MMHKVHLSVCERECIKMYARVCECMITELDNADGYCWKKAYGNYCLCSYLCMGEYLGEHVIDI